MTPNEFDSNSDEFDSSFSSSVEEIVSSKGSSKAFLIWYDDETDKDIEEFYFKKPKNKGKCSNSTALPTLKSKGKGSNSTTTSTTSLPDITPPTCHVEELEGSDTSGARSMSSDSTTPLSPNHPLTHTTPTLVPVLRRTARMVVRVPPAMSPGLSASIAEVAAMSNSAFRRGDEEEDEEIEESLDSNSVSEDAEDEGHTTKDEDPTAGDEGLGAGDEGLGMGVKSLSLGRDEVVPEGQQRASPVVETAVESERPEIVSALRHPTLTTWMDPEDGIVYIDVRVYPPPAPPSLIPPSLEWSSGSLPISPAPSIVPSPISSPMISLIIPSPVASPATAKTEGFLTELGARDEMQQELLHDHMRYRFRSLEHEQERVAVTTRAIWRPVLALESWAGQTDAQRAAL
ncbi:hypothetical protein Tco_0045115 [Tanacetum coccineum]